MNKIYLRRCCKNRLFLLGNTFTKTLVLSALTTLVGGASWAKAPRNSANLVLQTMSELNSSVFEADRQVTGKGFLSMGTGVQRCMVEVERQWKYADSDQQNHQFFSYLSCRDQEKI